MRKSGRSAGRNGSDFGRILIRRSVGHFKPNPPVRFLGLHQPRFGRFGPRKPKPARDVVLGPNPGKGGLILPDWKNGQKLARFFRKFAKMRIFAKSGEKRSLVRARQGRFFRISAEYYRGRPKNDVRKLTLWSPN